MNRTGIFAAHAHLYRQAGYQPRPIKPGTKHCPIKGWNKPDTEFSADDKHAWIERHAQCGIGLRLGSSFPDGTKLGALDIDDGRFERIARQILQNPTCARVGARGTGILVRYKGDLKIQKFDIAVEGAANVHVGELLGDGRLLVLPPTIHPDTRKPYRWIGEALLDVDFTDLPLLEL